MKRILFLFFQLFLKTLSFITFDSGDIVLKYLNVPDFACYNGNILGYTITFSGEFENPPQVFLSREYLDQDQANLLMFFSIESITNTNFVIRIQCVNKQVYRFNLKFWAYDDSRVEVINCFDWTTFGQQTLSHSNPNALKGIPSIISLSYDGAFTVDISIDSITSKSVTFTITKTGGLENVGFQILLIIEEGFIFVDRLQKSTDYISNALPIINNFSLIVAYVGFNFLNTDWIREYKKYTQTGTTIQYKVLHSNSYTKTENTHYAAWIATMFTQDFQAMETSKINAAQYHDLDENCPFNQIKIQELNIKLDSFVSNNLLVDKSINILNIEILNLCNKGKKYLTSFNICNSCEGTKTTKQIAKICLQMSNTLAFRFRLIASQVNIKEFYINLSDNGVQIKQILYNHKKTEVILVETLEIDQ